MTKDKSFFSATKLRHCLIEQIHTSELYVTNDLVLGEDKTDGILLYGTNAVGKTSLIRSVGIAVIMAQAGLYVPCAEFVYKPYKHIFTRIIGNDNLFKGLSTFAVEMSELRTILRIANENSLVLGDELCSGTENISAVSIFVAGIQKLYNLKSSFIFATHFHEITKYDEILSCDTLKLKHMTIFYNKELDKLQRMNPAAAEYSVLLNYAELLLELPWNEFTEDLFDIKKAQKILDQDHFGLEKVKSRILEYLAVLKLKGDATDLGLYTLYSGFVLSIPILIWSANLQKNK